MEEQCPKLVREMRWQCDNSSRTSTLAIHLRRKFRADEGAIPHTGGRAVGDIRTHHDLQIVPRQDMSLSALFSELFPCDVPPSTPSIDSRSNLLIDTHQAV